MRHPFPPLAAPIPQPDPLRWLFRQPVFRSLPMGEIFVLGAFVLALLMQ
ncbi:MAG: hypothetical protein HC844_06145 [Tabrizicola sp.]|nr:hypothetical protein [Tabrizicola sp.]